MVKKIAIFIGILIAGILIYAANRPDTFRIERSTSIKASPEKIFLTSTASISGKHGHPGKKSIRQSSAAIAVPTAARARCMRGKATRTSARDAWKSSSQRLLLT